MYEITITYNTGETKKIKTFTDPGTIDINDDRQTFALASIGRLVRMMNEQAREDYIFLGRLEKTSDGRYKPNRNYIVNGKEAQLEFDKVYPEIKLAFDKTQSQSMPEKAHTTSNGAGKHYAISDIHGCYGAYLEAIKFLKPEDTLYILGDAIDRGENGLKILKDIMARQKNSHSHIRFMLGNHECQMINVLNIIKKHSLTTNEIDQYSRAGRIEHHERKEGMPQPENYYDKNVYKQILEGFNNSRKQKEQILANIPKQVSRDDIETIYVWIDGNEGRVTLSQYLQLPEQEQEAIYQFLTTSHVMGKTTIDGRKIVLAHAAPPNSKAYVQEFEKHESVGIRYGREYSELTKEVTESRDKKVKVACNLWSAAGYETIAGHQPKNGEIVEDKTNNYTCIDAGCGHRGNLAVYCIEDREVALWLDEQGNPVPGNNTVEESR